jgi:hypothetical protein
MNGWGALLCGVLSPADRHLSYCCCQQEKIQLDELLIFSGSNISVTDDSHLAPKYQLPKLVSQVLFPIFGNRGVPVAIKRNCSVAGLDACNGR